MNFKLIHVLLGTKVPHKSPNFESQLSIALVKICEIPHVIFQTTSPFFFKFCITLWCHERYLLCKFLDQTLHTFHARSQSKCKFLRPLSARIKIHQILVSFETTNRFSFKFCINLQSHEMQLLCTFLAGLLYTFNKRSLSKYEFGEIKSLKFGNLMGYLRQNIIKFQLKKYIRIVSHKQSLKKK